MFFSKNQFLLSFGVFSCCKTGKNIFLKYGCYIRTAGCRCKNRWKELQCCDAFLDCWLHFNWAVSDGCPGFQPGLRVPSRVWGDAPTAQPMTELCEIHPQPAVPSNSPVTHQLLPEFHLSVSQMIHIEGFLWLFPSGSPGYLHRPLKTWHALELNLPAVSVWVSSQTDKHLQ